MRPFGVVQRDAITPTGSRSARSSISGTRGAVEQFESTR